MRVYPSFTAFMEKSILPEKQLHPSHIRLDGEKTGGNREPFGYFRHQSTIWRVHSDTHYEPLLIAYEALKKGEVKDPFTRKSTLRGHCLELTSLLRKQQRSRPKYLYIYEHREN